MRALQCFTTDPFIDALKAFFQELKVPVDYLSNEPALPADILNERYKPHNEAHRLMGDVYALGMVDDAIFEGRETFGNLAQVQQLPADYDGLLLFGIQLVETGDNKVSRGKLAEITRAFNRAFPYIPVTIVFHYGRYVSIANGERVKYKQEWREGEKVGKVSVLKDIDTLRPHAAHLRILGELKIGPDTRTFAALYAHWQRVLDIRELNKQFYQKLFNWYMWSLTQAKFPQTRAAADMISDDVHQSESLIRLLSRLLFCWFMKEKGLINPNLFQIGYLQTILKGFVGSSATDTIYYKAILQNLFFATLNRPIDERKALAKGFNPKEYGDPLVYRYEDLFVDGGAMLSYFENIPFLNGGLFDCLDQRKDDSNPIEIRLDGFSSNKSKQPVMPDKLFFGEYPGIDLSREYDDKKKNKVTVFGLIDILHQYKFTIEENTPIEEEVALDPELLGKVFENLLASYNPETRTTARKQTGSFYTPREIVNYMVDESLICYLKNCLRRDVNDLNDTQDANDYGINEQNPANHPNPAYPDPDTRLRSLFSYQPSENPFGEGETLRLIQAINNVKILDPACGSGAFPMGVLQKLIHVLRKLDPENKIWFDLVIANFPPAMRAIARQRLEKENWNFVRKLGIIQECIYGVDIQPIAIQISKLRFFIALLVDQTENPDLPNRGFEPLPNLDFKLVAANTLVAAPESDTATTGIFSGQSDPFFTAFDDLTNEYFNVHLPRDKKAKKEKILALIDKKIKEKQKLLSRAKDLQNAKQTAAGETEIRLWGSYANLFKHEAVGFFEIKYMFPKVGEGFDVVIGNPPYVQLQSNSGILANQFKNQGYQTFERTGDIYSLFYEKGLQLLRHQGALNFITSNKWMRAGYGASTRAYFAKHNPLKLIDLGSGIFESATVDTNILLIQKTQNQRRCLAADLSKKQNLQDFDNLPFVMLSDLGKEAWTIANQLEQDIKAKIERIGKPLKEWDVEIYRGILTGYNEAFIIDGKKKDELVAQDPKSAEIIKPILRGRDIKRYKAEFADLWLIATFPALKLNIDDYPAVKNYLLSFGKRLHQTGEEFIDENGQKAKARKKTGNQWFETQDQIGYYKEFEMEKIVWKIIGNKMAFQIDFSKSFLNNACYILTGKHLKYIVGILNNPAITWYSISTNMNKTGVGDVQVGLQNINIIPIPELSETEQQPFITLVEKILQGKAQNEDTTHLEKQIDQLVYQLYGLTEEEINLIEGNR